MDKHHLCMEGLKHIMDNFVIDVLLDFYHNKGLEIQIVGKPYYGDQCIVVPFDFDGKRYYNKFFIGISEATVTSEVRFVDYLHNSNISVPEFLEINNHKVFYTNRSTFPAYFFATKEIENDHDTADISDQLIRQFISKISELHLVAMKFPCELEGINTISDFQRMLSLYVMNKQLIDNVGFDCYIKSTIELEPDIVPVYPIHSDLHTANILTNDNSFVAFVDFSDLRYAGFEDDLGKLMQNLIGAKNLQVTEIEKYIQYYESLTHIAISRKNLYISIVYHILERFVDKCKGGISDGYVKKIERILINLSQNYCWR